MPINLRVGAEFDERSAREAAKDAQNYYDRQKTEIKVKSDLDEASARQVVRDAERAGATAGAQFRTGLTQGINQAFGNGEANAPTLDDVSNHLIRQYQSLPGLQR
jgi:hypothetical protein